MLPNPILTFTLFGKSFSIYMYGICIAAGIIACMAVFYVYTKKKNMDRDLQDFIFVVAIISIAAGFLFAKLFQAFYNYIETGNFNFYKAGITVMGGVLGGAAVFLAVYFGFGKLFFKGKKKGIHFKEFNKVFCVAPCCITIAHAFGRIGCLMAGCCHGKYLGTEYVVGGIWMKHGGVSGYYVPTQLYEAIFLFALFAVLTILYYKDFNIIMHVYLIAYGIWRIFIEFFRDDARGAEVLGLYPSQWTSILFIIIGVGLFVFYIAKKIPMRNKYQENNKIDKENNEK